MKIIPIFETKLFAFQYKGEEVDEFVRLLDLWTDIGYLYKFAKDNNVLDIERFIETIINDAEELQDYLENLNFDEESFSFYFRPLSDSSLDTGLLSKQKGKRYRSKLRLYAIKIDENCFVVTGGAIKMTQTMQEHPDTAKELKKLQKAFDFLKEKNVSDLDTMYELIIN